jgi:uncharacterized RDD family membrane protein YckC
MNRNPYAPPAAALADVGEPGAVPVRPDQLAREDFGGFWMRVLAYAIDVVILYLPKTLLIEGSMRLIVRDVALSPFQSIGWQFAIGILTEGAYFVAFWSSPWQASIGKRICGQVVTSENLTRLSVGGALWRYVALLLSSFAVVGVLTIPLSSRRRALHDMLAKTLVVKRHAIERAIAESGGALPGSEPQ